MPLWIRQCVFGVNEYKRDALTGQLRPCKAITGDYRSPLLLVEELALHVYGKVGWVDKEEVDYHTTALKASPKERTLVGEIHALLQPEVAFQGQVHYELWE